MTVDWLFQEEPACENEAVECIELVLSCWEYDAELRKSLSPSLFPSVEETVVS